jgi:hypothetical protein
MSWATAAALLFLGFAMMLDGRGGEKRVAADDGGAALFIAGLVVALSGVLVLIGAVRGALAGAG